MSKGADPKANDNAALLLAIKLQHDNQIEWLAANGAILNTDEQDLSPLDVVTDVRTLKLLERRGLVLDSKATSMTSLALNNAVYDGNEDMVKYLLMKGANFNCDGEYATKLAVEMLAKEMSETLLPGTVLPPELQSRANIVELLQKKDANPMAHIVIGENSFSGHVEDADKALEWIKRVSASYDVGEGDLAAQEAACKKWDVRPLSELRAAAERGDAAAQFLLGEAYDFGLLDLSVDHAQAAAWYRKAAAAGIARAQFNLGSSFLKGEGVVRDAAEAARLYRLAADQGLPEAIFNLGVCYHAGEGVVQDAAEAARLFRLAADQGLTDAIYNLGVLYRDGTGVPQDHAAAFAHFRRAAELGQLSAMSELGILYRDGTGVPQDYSEAFYWAEKAAKQGNERGLYHMAKYTYAGLGTKKDDKLARQMFAKLLSSKDEHVKTHAQEQLDMMRAEKTMKMREVFKPAVELPKCSIDGAPSSASCEACKKPACSSHMSSQAGVLLCSSCHGCSFDLKPMPDNNSGKCDRCKQLVCVNHCTGTGGGGAVCFACEPPVKQVGKTVNVEGFVSAKQLKGKDKEREQQLKEEAKSEKQSKIASEIEAAKEKAKSLAEKAAEREAVRAAKAAEKYGGKKGKKGGK